MNYQEPSTMNADAAAQPVTPLVYYKDSAGRAGFIKAVLLISICLSFGNLYTAWNAHEYYQAILSSPAYLTGQSVEVHNPMTGNQALIMLGYMGASLALVIAFCMWVYRVCWNTHVLGGVNLPYTPGWAVGWFFIPLANIVMPCLVMQSIYKASKHPVQWRKVGASKLILAWWVLGLLSHGAGRASVAVGRQPHASLEMLSVSQQFAMFSALGSIIVCGLLFLIVTDIVATQSSVFRYLSENPELHPAAVTQTEQVATQEPERPVRQPREAAPLCQRA